MRRFVVVAALLFLAPSAGAVSDGITGRSGKQSNAAGVQLTCTQCHGTLAPAPLIVADGLLPRYDVGGIATFTLRVQTQSALEADPGEKAGFNAATTAAGVFLGSDLEQTLVNAPGEIDNEITQGPEPSQWARPR